MAARAYSPLTRDVARILGKRIRAARIGRSWTLEDLAERVGVSRVTVGKIERGDLSVGIGTAFEAAVLTGVPLLAPDPAVLRQIERETDLELALLPSAVQPTRDGDEF